MLSRRDTKGGQEVLLLASFDEIQVIEETTEKWYASLQIQGRFNMDRNQQFFRLRS